MTEVASELENMPELVIVSGMSGAGRTEGHACVRGSWIFLRGQPAQRPYRESAGLNRACPANPDNHRRIAVVCDARSGGFFKSLMEELSKLKSAGVDYRGAVLGCR